MNIWEMCQTENENIWAFASRIIGVADLCDLKVPCTAAGCEATPSYRDEKVLQVLLKGMADLEIRSRVLSRTSSGELLKLHDVIEYVGTEETSVTESRSMVHENPAQVAALKKSSYRKKDLFNELQVPTILTDEIIVGVQSTDDSPEVELFWRSWNTLSCWRNHADIRQLNLGGLWALTWSRRIPECWRGC